MEEGYEFPSSSSAIVRIGIVFGNDYRWFYILGMTETLLTLFVIPFDDRAIVPERNRAADSHADVEAVFSALNQVADVPVNGGGIPSLRCLGGQSRDCQIAWAVDEALVRFGAAVGNGAEERRAAPYIIQRVAILFARFVVYVAIRNAGTLPTGAQIADLVAILKAGPCFGVPRYFVPV